LQKRENVKKKKHNLKRDVFLPKKNYACLIEGEEEGGRLSPKKD